MGVLSALFGGTFYGLSGGNKKTQSTTPPINAASSDEESFIKCVVYRYPPTRLAAFHNANT